MSTDGAQPADVAEILRQSGAPGSGRRWAMRGTVALAAAGALAAVLLVARGRGGEANPYLTQPAQRGGLVVTVSATGNLEPLDEVDVGSEVSGLVRTVEAEVNDRVEAGQVLARLDTAKLEAQLGQTRASLASARAQVLEAQAGVREAEANLARMRRLEELTQGKTPSAADLEAAEATVERARASEATARAGVAQVESLLAAHETDLSRSVIRAPVRGMVLSREVDPGQTVAASLQAPTLFVLAEDLTRMELVVDVDEADVGQVRDGQTATFAVDAYPERAYQARITRVNYGSETNSGVVTYEAVLEVDNPDLSLRPGMTCTAEIEVLRVEDALLVPNTALRFTPKDETAASSDASASSSGERGLLAAILPRPPQRARTAATLPEGAGGKGACVWVLRGGQPEPIAVSTGASDGLNTEVTGGKVLPGMALLVGEGSAAR